MKDITANSTYNINPELKGIKTLSKVWVQIAGQRFCITRILDEIE